MTESEPLVSVIIPTHNRAALLPRAVHSVLRQTYCYLECIVVDDGSIDDTERVVKQLHDTRLRYLRHETSRNASVARNTGFAHARGDLIAFLDDDDEWLPRKLEKQVELMQTLSPDYGMVYCWLDRCTPDGRVVKEIHPTCRGFIFPLVLERQRIGNTSTLLVRRSVMDEVGGFDEMMLRSQDADFIRRVSRGHKVDLVPEVLARMYVEHGHRRMTRFDEDGLRARIASQLITMDKFRDDFFRYPKRAAYQYAKLAFNYGRLGDWRSAIVNFLKAIRRYPLSIQVYLFMFRTMKARLKIPAPGRNELP